MGQHEIVTSGSIHDIPLQNSGECLQLLKELHLPVNAYLFTADAKAMYTNIDTEMALKIIPEYLRKNKKMLQL